MSRALTHASALQCRHGERVVRAACIGVPTGARYTLELLDEHRPTEWQIVYEQANDDDVVAMVTEDPNFPHE